MIILCLLIAMIQTWTGKRETTTMNQLLQRIKLITRQSVTLTQHWALMRSRSRRSATAAYSWRNDWHDFRRPTTDNEIQDGRRRSEHLPDFQFNFLDVAKLTQFERIISTSSDGKSQFLITRTQTDNDAAGTWAPPMNTDDNRQQLKTARTNTRATHQINDKRRQVHSAAAAAASDNDSHLTRAITSFSTLDNIESQISAQQFKNSLAGIKLTGTQ